MRGQKPDSSEHPTVTLAGNANMSQKDQSKWADRLLAPNDSYCNMPDDTSVARELDIKVCGRQVFDGSVTSAFG